MTAASPVARAGTTEAASPPLVSGARRVSYGRAPAKPVQHFMVVRRGWREGRAW